MDERPSFRILFVCTGNTCRSPLAEALARRELERRGWSHVEVGSAGIAARDGAPASPGSVQAASSDGLDLSSHSARLLDQVILDEADVVLTMSAGHLAAVRAAGADEKAELLSTFAGDSSGGVPDPFGAPLPVYMQTLRVLDGLVGRALDRLPGLLGA